MAKSLLLERVRSAIRVRHYSMATERAYLTWIRRFIVLEKDLPWLDDVIRAKTVRRWTGSRLISLNG